jgi:uncharacterized membrane protein YqgA involved in biofilm formation
MALLGTMVNAFAIVLGAGLGVFLTRIPERMKQTIIQGLALAVFIIGLSMALKAAYAEGYDLFIVIVSLVLGGVIGEMVDIEGKLQAFGNLVERKLSRFGGGKISEAFVFASLVYCVGAMAIVGALESGLQGVHKILYTKAMLDGFSAIFFTSTLGIGIALSALPVFLYQGSIALMASWLANVLQEPIIAVMSATGGVLIMGIALNVLEIKKVSVGNMLPAIFVAAAVKWVTMAYGL